MNASWKSAGKAVATVKVATLAIAGLFAGCASSGGVAGGGDDLLSDWRPPAGQSCETHSEPGALPPASEVVDLDGLEAGLRREGPGGPDGFVLFSIRQDTTGTWTRVAPIESDLSTEVQADLAELLRPSLTTSPMPPLRLRLEVADESSVTIGRQQSCAPAVANPQVLSRVLGELADRYGVSASAVLQVEARTDGTAGEATLSRRSGDLRVDEEILRIASRLRFHPALSDRIPVETVAVIPVTVRPPSRP